ncbi:MAG: hypothetical protein HY796_11505 [Elusimicrobia bacterium]|nr:hypothetical protein [Elusimicrobiota bacterium]
MKFSTEFKSHRWKKFLLVVSAVFTLYPIPYTLSPAFAAITQSINYQGFLVSKITNLAVDSPQDMKFAIYDVPNGGSALFTESRCNVSVLRGRYDVEIGSAVSGGIPGALFTGYNGLWLEIQVDSDGDCTGVYEAMSPRVRLQASPYAFNSLYASTASAGPVFSPAGTPPFKVDLIGTHDETTNGAVTISSNLFVMGGISVGSISPGTQLSVSGMVESKGDWPICAYDPLNYTCGFRFPDGSVQTIAAGDTLWRPANGDQDLYNVNPGNVGISTNTPQAKLHISTGPGETGNILIVSTGSTNVFRVTGQGKVYGSYFYGDGANLSAVNDSTKVRKIGDTITGTLFISSPIYSSVAGASLIVNDAAGIVGRRLQFTTNVEISSTTSAYYGGLYVSTHVYLAGGAKIIGNGSQLTGVISEDTSKVLKSGDTMSGHLIIAGSSVTIITSNTAVAPYSLAVTTDAAMLGWHLYVSTAGGVGVGTNNMTHKLRVEGGILAVSSVTAQDGFYTQGPLSANSISLVNDITASTGTFFGGWGADKYSIETTSGIKVLTGVVSAPYFKGDGSQLTNVIGTDTAKVAKTGDTMTGPLTLNAALTVRDSSVTVINTSAGVYALVVSTTANPGSDSLVVTDQGKVGIHIPNPTYYLDVYKEMRIINQAGPADIRINTFGDFGYIRWSDDSLASGGRQGALGFGAGTRDFIYRAAASDPATDGAEVFRIKSDELGNWKFGVGTINPEESLHINANMLIGQNLAAPALYVSTTSSGVGISTTTTSHKLVVAGGVLAVSSVTAQGGFYGDMNGNLYGKIYTSSITMTGNQGIGNHFAMLKVGEQTGEDYTVVIGTNNSADNYYDMVVTPGGRVGIGVNIPDTDVMLHTIKGIRIGSSGDGGSGSYLDLKPSGGPTYIKWDEQATPDKGVLGFLASSKDLQYRTGATNMTSGTEVLRIMGAGGAVFKSSLTVTGEYGLTDSDDVLNVAGAKLVVKKDGRVGLGLASPAYLLDVNGGAVVSSSFVVTGTGLSGTQTGLSVIGSTLVVRADGKIGIGVASPAQRLDVNGNAQFGAGVTKSTFTAEGYWQPRWLTSAGIQALAPGVIGQVIGNSVILDLCVSTGTAVGQWALAGSKGVGNCF